MSNKKITLVITGKKSSHIFMFSCIQESHLIKVPYSPTEEQFQTILKTAFDHFRTKNIEPELESIFVIMGDYFPYVCFDEKRSFWVEFEYEKEYMITSYDSETKQRRLIKFADHSSSPEILIEILKETSKNMGCLYPIICIDTRIYFLSNYGRQFLTGIPPYCVAPVVLAPAPVVLGIFERFLMSIHNMIHTSF